MAMARIRPHLPQSLGISAALEGERRPPPFVAARCRDLHVEVPDEQVAESQEVERVILRAIVA